MYFIPKRETPFCLSMLFVVPLIDQRIIKFKGSQETCDIPLEFLSTQVPLRPLPSHSPIAAKGW